MKPKILLFLFAVLLAAVASLADTSATYAVGNKVTFSVTNLAGTPPITYQWQKDGANIPGATGATYIIPAVSPADTGTYEVVLTNPAGPAKSDKAVFTVAVLASGQIRVTSP